MKFKLFLAIAMILCLFTVLPVSAQNIINPTNNQIYNIGEANSVTIEFNYDTGFQAIADYSVNNGEYNTIMHALYNNPYSETFQLNSNANQITFDYVMIYQENRIQHIGFTVNYVYSESGGNGGNNQNIYTINIDLNEQLLELGTINDLEQTFNIGSSSDRLVKEYSTYQANNCSISDLQRNYVKVKFNKEYNSSEIFLSGNAIKDTTISDFNTLVKFNYTYKAGLQSFIQTYDYQTGNILSGVNLSVYEVIENGDSLELGDLILSDSNAESQIILNLKQDTDYFIENELNGYFAVKNENIASLNNRYGYLWNPTLSNPLRLYYSRLDPSAQYNANFIVQDVNNNGISGVSVTMDNSITKISNAIGGLTFNNVSAGSHTFTFTKNGYQTAQRTIDIQLQYAAFTQTLFTDDQIIQPTVAPTIYPTTQPTVSPSTQPTLSPIDKPSNIMESVSFGFAKIFGVKTVENANYIFALMLILFPAVIAGGITHQALGFIAGGLVGFVFALAVGLVPVWVFFAMCLLAVIFMVLKGGNEGF